MRERSSVSENSSYQTRRRHISECRNLVLSLRSVFDLYSPATSLPVSECVVLCQWRKQTKVLLYALVLLLKVGANQKGVNEKLIHRSKLRAYRNRTHLFKGH